MRPFTEKEREVIDRDLRKTGRALFVDRGWKKTGIDDLCRAAGIARGTFYQFYPSKDAFFLALLTEAERVVKADLLTALADPTLDGQATLRALLDQTLTVIDRHPVLRFAFADPEEPAPWLRSLDGPGLEALTREDDATADQVLALLAIKGIRVPLEAPAFAGLLRALVLLPLSRRVIGEAVFEASRTALVEALTRGLS